MTRSALERLAEAALKIEEGKFDARHDYKAALEELRVIAASEAGNCTSVQNDGPELHGNTKADRSQGEDTQRSDPAPTAEPEPITEEWLGSVGFKFREPEERQPFRHWTIKFDEPNDCGLYLETTKPGWINRAGEYVNADAGWFLWIGREHAFFHLRHVHTQAELVSIVEAIAGRAWDQQATRLGLVPTAHPAARSQGEDTQRSEASHPNALRNAVERLLACPDLDEPDAMKDPETVEAERAVRQALKDTQPSGWQHNL